VEIDVIMSILVIVRLNFSCWFFAHINKFSVSLYSNQFV
jgi:hypothetical protein